MLEPEAQPKTAPKSMDAADLLALALDHRKQAERSSNIAEQLQLHRVADIYWGLATLDIPVPVLSRLIA